MGTNDLIKEGDRAFRDDEFVTVGINAGVVAFEALMVSIVVGLSREESLLASLSLSGVKGRTFVTWRRRSFSKLVVFKDFWGVVVVLNTSSTLVAFVAKTGGFDALPGVVVLLVAGVEALRSDVGA